MQRGVCQFHWLPLGSAMACDATTAVQDNSFSVQGKVVVVDRITPSKQCACSCGCKRQWVSVAICVACGAKVGTCCGFRIPYERDIWLLCHKCLASGSSPILAPAVNFPIAQDELLASGRNVVWDLLHADELLQSGLHLPPNKDYKAQP